MNRRRRDVRINKYISDAGVCSRREADRRIAEGRVFIETDGITRKADPGTKVGLSDRVFLDGIPVTPKKERVYLIYNKPKGIVCTRQTSDPDNIIRAVGYDGYITYAGRLDKDSTGLVLLTDDGELNNTIAKAVNRHEKEYICEVGRDINEDFLRRMREGVPVLDTVTRPCIVRKISARKFSIVLTQGLNRQIRRMCGYLGYSVVSLKRIRIQNLYLGDLPEGEWRFLTSKEITDLRRSCGMEEKDCREESYG
ncbi:MAG: pseudouridine synthase [Lachnospiraceae bacterium]|nr:pseudouridine synthase [Lachnospiraceae bacterium]